MIRSIAYFVITSFLCTIGIELYIRQTEISAVSETDFDEEVGRIIRPNAKVVYYNENFTYSQINKYGYLGPPYAPKKAPETFRIAILGDSYVEGFQVLSRHHFRTILEENLREELGFDDVEILNFGRSGFGLGDAYAYEQNFAADFNPNLKIYFLGARDFYKSSTDELLPKWKLEEGKLIQDTSYRNSTKLKVYNAAKIGLQNSAVLQMVRNCINVIKDGKAEGVLLGKLNSLVREDKQAGTEADRRKQIASGPLPKISKAILDELNDDRNVIVVNKDSTHFPKQILKILFDNGIRSINLADTLTGLKRMDIDPRYWPVTDTRGHWNYTAHKAVGEYLSRVLSERVNLNSSRLGYSE